jgi:hypothetical protein
MKRIPSGDPVRWRERDVDAHALEARAAALAEAARQAQPLGAQAIARVRAGVLERAAVRPGAFELRRRPIVVRLAVGLALLLVCAATADGAAILWSRYVSRPTPVAPPPAVERPPQAARRPHRLAASKNEALGETVPEPVAAPLPTPASDDAPKSHPAHHVAAPAPASPPPERASPLPAPEPAPAPAGVPDTRSAKVTEAGLVAEALSQLRHQGDPRAALATLDVYARAFPHGVLETEASRTRLEALIRLDDRKAALALLDAMPGLSDEPGTDLPLTRAELRAASGRYREALADFTQVVESEGGASAASERALYGRAVCLGRLGEDDRARADLLAYERRFPSGRFAPEVRRLLSDPAAAQRP